MRRNGGETVAEVIQVPCELKHLDQLKPEAAKTVYEILARVLERKRAKANAQQDTVLEKETSQVVV